MGVDLEGIEQIDEADSLPLDLLDPVEDLADERHLQLHAGELVQHRPGNQTRMLFQAGEVERHLLQREGGGIG
ncbi:MAG: hypothetical protein MPW14_13395 [Candidatus Manganitrophus sp.]|nr:MAG: hypothetical protein MPW14_13395 [Candidatus Manganitrophus sp.]